MAELIIFSDESIVKQDIVSVSNRLNKSTNGFSLIIECPKDFDELEIVLTYEELKLAVEELEIPF